MFDRETIEQIAEALAKHLGSPAQSAKRLLTVEGAAEYISRSVDAMRHLIARGIVPVTKIDGRAQVDRLALDRLIEAHTYFEG